MTLLGVNIDHIATVRQARRERFPDPVEAALEAVRGGADGITAHLREDRRHIQDADIERLKTELSVPLNLEMAAAEDILKVAERVRPDWVCLVPEKRLELTTEGGLNVVGSEDRLKDAVRRLHTGGTRVSFFIEPELATVEASARCGADAVELHTGVYARISRETAADPRREIDRIVAAARSGQSKGLLINAGHGLDYANVGAIHAAHPFNEFNIGFAIIARALWVGLRTAVGEMKDRLVERSRPS
jgi:pyridoxine 5-phosphate synthase